MQRGSADIVPEESIRLVAYDAAWPALFDEEHAELEPILTPWLAGPIEHIGSTAVPGLTAKPVIDIMAAVTDLASSLPACEAVAQLGYIHFPYRPDVMHWFCKPSPAHRTHHLHLVPMGTPLWSERLLFRDYLRSSRAVADEYAQLKVALAKKHQYNREAYTDAKGEFVMSIVERARRATSHFEG